MEKNHICKKCGGIAGWDSYFQSWICTRCGNEEPKPITNADRIRAMTDEELAEWIYSVQDEDALRKANFLLPLSKEWWLDWLKSEVSANG